MRLLPQPRCPWVSNVVLFPALRVVHWGLLLRLPWRAWVCPMRARCGGGAAACHRGSGSTRCSGELEARAAGNISL